MNININKLKNDEKIYSITKLLRRKSESLKALNDSIWTSRVRQRHGAETLKKTLNDGIYFNKTCTVLLDLSIDYIHVLSTAKRYLARNTRLVDVKLTK